eukprot:13430239-Ditylum_brightwellii.AAC.1
MPSPVTGPESLSNMQYYCSYFNPLYQYLAEKLTNTLAIAATTTARALDTDIHPVLPNHKVPSGYSQNILSQYHKKIVTCGVPNKCLEYPAKTGLLLFCPNFRDFWPIFKQMAGICIMYSCQSCGPLQAEKGRPNS